jgi:formylglycine-generating enzyme
MSAHRWTWTIACVTGLTVSLGAAACSGNSGGSLASNTDDGGVDATESSLACTTNTDCAARVPPTTPAGCATGTCNAVQGVCVFSAKDEDGDGHPANNCVSTNGVTIVEGDDCNDHDPNLYPGHSEVCSSTENGGTPLGTLCAQGLLTCLPNGTESACTGTVACVNQACVSGMCTGSCSPGQTQCNGQQAQVCDATGHWQNDGPMCGSSQTCVGGVGSDAGATASCHGGCSPGQATCSGAQPQSCGPSGQWQNTGSACSGSTPECYRGACVVCAPATVGCSAGQQPQLCNASGSAWQPSGSACSASTPACLNGVCVACSPGSTQCGPNGTQLQTCDATGSWQNEATCVNQACAGGGSGADAGAATCQGICAPGQTHCVRNGVETCQGDGTWGTGTWGTFSACDHQTCVGGVGTAAGGAALCQGVCAPGETQCGTSTQPQTCDGTGNWQNSTACSGSTPLCSNASCIPCPGSSTFVNGSCQTTSGTSCAAGGAGLTNCASSSESCCTNLEVPGGTYYQSYSLSYSSGGGFPSSEADPATISGFRLDKYLVTVGRFRQFVAAWNGGSGYTPPAGSGKHTHLNGGQGLANSGSAGSYETGWLSSDNSNIAPTNANLVCNSSYPVWTNTAGSQENLPINCLNWYEAYAFCIWDGGFLPSEAEWEYAAAGGTSEREYPWGWTEPGTACPGTGCEYAIYNCDYPNGSGSCPGVTSIAPVGTATLGAGLWGQLDLEGDMAEWNLDWLPPYLTACTDCANLNVTSARTVQGSCFNDNSTAMVVVWSGAADSPTARDYTVGLRCARTP